MDGLQDTLGRIVRPDLYGSPIPESERPTASGGRGLWDLVFGSNQPAVTVTPVIDDKIILKLTVALSVVLIVGFVMNRITR